MALSFSKSTDSEHEIKLDSVLISAYWTARRAVALQPASFEINTEFVGDGAPIEVSAKSANGRDLGQIKDKIKGNKFAGAFDIPEDIELGDKVYFEVKLPKNSLDGESDRIPAYPPIRISNLAWSASEARRGDVLTLTAEIEGLPPGTEVAVIIYEYDTDSAHDKIVELSAPVTSERIEVNWEYEYHEDTDRINSQDDLDPYGGQYAHPEYFFTIKIGSTEFGREQQSGLLRFKDWLEIEGEDAFGRPLRDGQYTLTLADGTEIKGSLDNDGHARVADVPPGQCTIEFEPPKSEDEVQSE